MISHDNVCFGLQYIACVTANHHVPLVDVAGPSAERNSAVFSIPVEPSIVVNMTWQVAT